MLPPAINPLVLRWFDRWCRNALRRSFHRVHLFTDPPADDAPAWPALDRSVPRLYVANHVSFWDGILLNHLVRTHCRQPLYCMVDAKQVAEHPFFRRVGGFSIDRDSPRDRVVATRFAAELLTRQPSPAVMVFPQGSIRPAAERTSGFEPGVAHVIARVPEVRVVPVSLRYEFWLEQRPEALVHIGRERTFSGMNRREVMTESATAVDAGLAALDDHCRAFAGGRVLLQGKASVSRWKDRFRRAPLDA